MAVPHPPLLLRRVAHLATFDDDGTELSGVDVLCRNGSIESIGVNLDAPDATLTV